MALKFVMNDGPNSAAVRRPGRRDPSPVIEGSRVIVVSALKHGGASMREVEEVRPGLDPVILTNRIKLNLT